MVIDPINNIAFRSAEHIYGNVKRFLSSFDSAGLLDEGEFPRYIHDALKTLGLGICKEADAVVKVKDYRACLPEDFEMLHAAYKCTPFVSREDMEGLQASLTVFNDITWEIMDRSTCDAVEVVNNEEGTVAKVTIRQTVGSEEVRLSFKDFVLLRLSPNANRARCVESCANILANSPLEISIDQRQLLTNFSSSTVYMKYYAFPLDEAGVPLVPDIVPVEKFLEWEIIYQVLLQMWVNNSVPDLQNRWQYAEGKALEWKAEAKYLNKLPSFNLMVNHARRKRYVNPVMIFAR